MAAHRFGPVAGLPAGAVATGQVVEGQASWYGPGFDGRPTASGALYDQEGWTVASRELPLGTVLVVTRGARSVLVLVNDRGPYVPGRVLDLSHAVAVELGTVGAGVAGVRAEVVRLP
jgi:rare lipoprotein A